MPDITADSLTIPGERRRPGRPRAEEPLDQRVTIRLPTHEYDRLIQLSQRQGEPVTSIVRSLLRIRIPRDYPSANK